MNEVCTSNTLETKTLSPLQKRIEAFKSEHAPGKPAQAEGAVGPAPNDPAGQPPGDAMASSSPVGASSAAPAPAAVSPRVRRFGATVAAMAATAASAAASAVAAPAATRNTARAERYRADEPDLAEPVGLMAGTDVVHEDEHPVDLPQTDEASLSPGQRARRAVLRAAAQTPVESAPAEDAGAQAPAWADDTRPVGSAFSAEDWQACEQANPGCVVVEMFKPTERALITMERTNLDAITPMLLHRALMVGMPLAKENGMSAQRSMTLLHRDDGGRIWEYAVIMSAERQEANKPYLGSVLRNNYEQADLPERSAERSGRSRAERYGGGA